MQNNKKWNPFEVPKEYSIGLLVYVLSVKIWLVVEIISSSYTLRVKNIVFSVVQWKIKLDALSVSESLAYTSFMPRYRSTES